MIVVVMGLGRGMNVKAEAAVGGVVVVNIVVGGGSSDAADAVGIAIVREAILLRVVKVPNTIGKKC